MAPLKGTYLLLLLTFTEVLLEAQLKARPTRRLPFRARNLESPISEPEIPKNDLLLHSLLAPALAHINTDDILSSSASSLAVQPQIGPIAFNPNPKRGPRGKETVKEGEILPAPGTATALAVASGQQRGRGAGASQAQWVLGKSLAELKKMESASQLEMDSDWARIQGTGSRRRTRGD